jgi:hypothetical protein
MLEGLHNKDNEYYEQRQTRSQTALVARRFTSSVEMRPDDLHMSAESRET